MLQNPTGASTGDDAAGRGYDPPDIDTETNNSRPLFALGRVKSLRLLNQRAMNSFMAGTELVDIRCIRVDAVPVVVVDVADARRCFQIDSTWLPANVLLLML